MILYNSIVKISKNRWIGYMLKVAFLLASSIVYLIPGRLAATEQANRGNGSRLCRLVQEGQVIGCKLQTDLPHMVLEHIKCIASHLLNI